MKHFFYKWISILSKEEQKHLKKHTQVLNEKYGKFVTSALSRISDWQENRQKETIELENIVATSEQKEGKKYLSHFIKGMNYLKSFLIDFLVLNQIKKDTVLTQKVLFKNAQERNFTEGYFYHLYQWEKGLEGQNNQSFDFSYNMFSVNYHRFFHPEFQKFKLKSHNNNQDYMPEVVLANSWEYLELFRLIAQTRLACEIEFQKLIVGKNKAILDNLKELDTDAVQQKVEDSIPLKVYFEIYQWLKKKDFYDISKLQSVIYITIDHIRFFSVEEQYSLLILLNNCIGRMMRHSDENEVLKKMFADVTVIGFQDNIFGKEVDMDINFFLGLYDTVRFVYPDFAVSMKEKHIHKLPTKNDEEWVLTYINVRELMQEKAYYEAILILKELEHHNNYGLTMRKFVLLLQCTYDLQNSTLNLKTEDISGLNSWMQIIENISKTFNTSNYLTKVSTSDRLTFFNFVAVASIFYLKTCSICEIKSIINNNPIFSIPWLNDKLPIYTKDSTSDFNDRLKTYHKILNLLSLENFSTELTD